MKIFRPKNACIFGANGSMGAQIGGIIAAFADIPVYMIGRDLQKAKVGIEIAVSSVRSNSIRDKLIPIELSDVKKILLKSDLIIESVAENYETKTEINKIISSVPNKKRVIGTNSSGLSIATLSQSLLPEDRENYFGIHFFNPPYKMLLCEIIPSKYSAKNLINPLHNFLEQLLLRKVVVASDTPGFIANRIGFQFLNEAVIFAEKFKEKGGIDYIDNLLGKFTGRPIGPLALIDFVGLDIHRSIVNNIFQNGGRQYRNSFVIPKFMKKMITSKLLGIKTNSGLYKIQNDSKKNKIKLVFDINSEKYRPVKLFTYEFITEIKDKIRIGDYRHAFQILKKDKSKESYIIRYFIAKYISYALSQAGNSTNSVRDVNCSLGYGFSWIPPTAFVDLLGGIKETTQFIKEHKTLDVPKALISLKKNSFGSYYTLQDEFDYRSCIKT
ncbi:3-hydroxyacyl-CoA dehydrogenase family protein [Candidatus Roizmanbacteria bacterium]|nr:3-hydroxyacyl-CoA dehydrogenase family protein [Candidatus Roizmanbacteria bacterium]